MSQLHVHELVPARTNKATRPGALNLRMLLQASRVGDVYLNTAEVIFETHTEPTLPTEQMRAPGALELGRLLDSQSTSLISLIASHPKKTLHRAIEWVISNRF